MEDEVMNLKRRISAIEEHLASTQHRLERQPRRDEQDLLQDNQRFDNVQGKLPSQDHLLALNKSRLYGPTHWLHKGHEVSQRIEHCFCQHRLTSAVQEGGSSS